MTTINELEQKPRSGLSDLTVGLGLLPCPFCGLDAKLITDGITAIACDTCGYYMNTGHKSVLGIKAIWNKRALVDA